MNKMTKMIVGVFCAFALVTSAFAADNTVATAKSAPANCGQAENWVLTLGGSGVNHTGNHGSSDFGVDVSLGFYGNLLFPTETGLRQGINYGNNDWTLNTSIYNDWTLYTFKNPKVDVFAGGAIGLEYGNQTLAWEIAPEAGLRLWVKKDVAIIGQVELPWDMAHWDFKDTVRYSLGLQVKF